MDHRPNYQKKKTLKLKLSNDNWEENLDTLGIVISFETQHQDLTYER